MSPKYLIDLIVTRFKRAPFVKTIKDPIKFSGQGALDGYGSGWSTLVTDNYGATFKVTVTLYSLGIE